MLLSETNKHLMLNGYKHTANNHCFSFNIHAKIHIRTDTKNGDSD